MYSDHELAGRQREAVDHEVVVGGLIIVLILVILCS